MEFLSTPWTWFIALVWFEYLWLGIAVFASIFLFYRDTGIGMLTIFGMLFLLGVKVDWIYILAYFILGIAWMIFKVRYITDNVIEEKKELAADRKWSDEDTKEQIRNRLRSKFSKDTLFYYITGWPFNVTSFIFGDLWEALMKRIKAGVVRMIDRMIEKAF